MSKDYRTPYEDAGDRVQVGIWRVPDGTVAWFVDTWTGKRRTEAVPSHVKDPESLRRWAVRKSQEWVDEFPHDFAEAVPVHPPPSFMLAALRANHDACLRQLERDLQNPNRRDVTEVRLQATWDRAASLNPALWNDVDANTLRRAAARVQVPPGIRWMLGLDQLPDRERSLAVLHWHAHSRGQPSISLGSESHPLHEQIYLLLSRSSESRSHEMASTNPELATPEARMRSTAQSLRIGLSLAFPAQSEAFFRRLYGIPETALIELLDLFCAHKWRALHRALVDELGFVGLSSASSTASRWTAAAKARAR